MSAERRKLELSLYASQLVGGAVLLRSVAYDRWITVAAALMLLLGATQARRGRTWGLGLTLAAAAYFPAAWAVGIAPFWFAVVGLVVGLPFAFARKALQRFDAGAATLLARLSVGAGVGVALAWKYLALALFQQFPSLAPSAEAQHGVALVALFSAMVYAAIDGRPRSAAVEAPGSTKVRVSAELDLPSSEEAPEEAEEARSTTQSKRLRA